MKPENLLRNTVKLNRRNFLRTSAAAAATATLATRPGWARIRKPVITGKTPKVIVIGLDGMDPFLAGQMMDKGLLPNFDRLRKTGGFRRLNTSIPPQSPVAWANFINGAGPGSHGIFDFIHREPENQCLPFFSVAKTIPGQGYWDIGKHKLQLDFWPINHKPPQTKLLRRGTPFWRYLDKARIDSTFYDLPSNYPPSRSEYGYHRCLSGLGTPDLLGTYGTYQHFSEDGPLSTVDEPGGKRSSLFFKNETAEAEIIGPENTLLEKPEPLTIKFLVHRDSRKNAAAIDIQGRRILLKENQWSDWVKLDFTASLPLVLPDKHISGICRFYLQQVSPVFELYVSPINADPTDPAIRMSEPPEFTEQISQQLGLFYTTGFQEDHKALSNGVFSDEEYARQAEMVLQERLELLDYARQNYDDGLLFFYFSSTDLQSHMFWWDSDLAHPTRSRTEAKEYFNHIKKLYQRMDAVIGDIIETYGNDATIIVMSDHGFANFKRQFALNKWLQANGYLEMGGSGSIMQGVNWSESLAYGLGINGLYLNLKGREKLGAVEPGNEKEQLIERLVAELEAIRDTNGQPVITKVHRTDKAYSGPAAQSAPDLIIGYHRGYRASWQTCLGGIDKTVLLDNDSAWSADHCADVSELPGVLFTNKPIAAKHCALVDLAPSILNIYGLQAPKQMTGRNIFKS